MVLVEGIKTLEALEEKRNSYAKDLPQFDQRIQAIEATNTKIYSISNDSLYVWENGIWGETVIQPLRNPTALEALDNEILVANSTQVVSYSENLIEVIYYI